MKGGKGREMERGKGGEGRREWRGEEKGTGRGGEGSLPLLADHFNHWLAYM